MQKHKAASEAGFGKVYDPHFRVDYWSADAILSHPDFPRARATYFDRVLALYGDDVFLNKLLMEAVRIVAFAVAICMEAGYREDDRETWPTIGNLKKALALFGLASPRRIEHIVSRLLQTGYLESRVSPLDRRVRLLIPTAKMIEHDRDWLTAHYAPLAALFGEADYVLPLGGNRQFQRAQRQAATGIFTQSAMVLLRNPDVLLFLARDAGVLVLVELAKAVAGRATPVVDLSLAQLGRRFAISRAHIRQLLLEAEARELVEIDQARRRITLKPRLLESLDRFVAEGMSNHDLTGAVARRQCGLARAGRPKGVSALNEISLKAAG